jgi:putative Ca2+/H+ antiporter (TMEM165/GDT1 family)
VLAGSAISSYLSPRTLHYLAGIGFLAIGVWTLWRA